MLTSIRVLLLSCLYCTTLFAQDLTIIGQEEQTIPEERTLSTSTKTLSKASLPKKITVFTVQLSSHAQQTILQHAKANEQTSSNTQILMSKSSNHVQLGMGKVPVLDQGQHGSCVTFAITAALDAAWNKDDYISQLCLLQLGNFLKTNGYRASGWDGSLGDYVLYQINAFGIINKKNQSKYGCGGAKDYSTYNAPKGHMSLQDYKKRSENVMASVSWVPMLDQMKVFRDKANMNDALTQVKAALNKGNRVTFATLLPRTDLGTMGAVGWNNYLNDTWVLSSDIKKELKKSKQFAGHQMIITGYDDSEMAIDSNGNKHYGLLTLRNSWGSWVADWGTFYMSYDYFKTLVYETQQIVRVDN